MIEGETESDLGDAPRCPHFADVARDWREVNPIGAALRTLHLHPRVVWVGAVFADGFGLGGGLLATRADYLVLRRLRRLPHRIIPRVARAQHPTGRRDRRPARRAPRHVALLAALVLRPAREPRQRIPHGGCPIGAGAAPLALAAVAREVVGVIRERHAVIDQRRVREPVAHAEIVVRVAARTLR